MNSPERKRALFSANPFGAAEGLTGLEMDSYAPFPFLPPIVPGKYGKVYEFRTYQLKPGGGQDHGHGFGMDRRDHLFWRLPGQLAHAYARL
jgi:hypothetical protein